MPDVTTILLIEDDKRLLYLLKEWLVFGGFSVIVAQDGVEAVTLLASNVSKPDIILSDYDLPGLNGCQLLKHVRHSERLREIPFMIITGNVEQVECGELKPDRLIAKPFEFNVLRIAIDTLLKEY